MEWLPGLDMHVMQEKAMQLLRVQNKPLTRQIKLSDAVFLTADVMLPLLQHMHEVGIVRCDVKPSNCVCNGKKAEFALVDFGLSKSMVVPDGSSVANKLHPWMGKDWLNMNHNNCSAFYRKEQRNAEFCGSNMYALL